MVPRVVKVTVKVARTHAGLSDGRIYCCARAYNPDVHIVYYRATRCARLQGKLFITVFGESDAGTFYRDWRVYELYTRIWIHLQAKREGALGGIRYFIRSTRDLRAEKLSSIKNKFEKYEKSV